MESVHQALIDNLRRALQEYVVEEPLLGQEADLLLRAGGMVLALEVKVSSQPGIPFSIGEANRVVAQCDRVERDVRRLLNPTHFQFGLLTNRTISSRGSQHLRERGIRIYPFSKDPKQVAVQLQKALHMHAVLSKEPLNQRVTNWTSVEIAQVLSAPSPQAGLQTFVKLVLGRAPESDQEVVERVRAIIETQQARGSLPRDTDLFQAVCVIMKGMLEQKQRKQLLSEVMERALGLTRYVQFLVQSVDPPQSSADELLRREALQAEGKNLQELIAEAQQWLDNGELSAETVSQMRDRVMQIGARLRGVVAYLTAMEDGAASNP